jgi:peptide/nickel transport system substrate-binding protein
MKIRKFSKVKARKVFRSRKRQVGDITESASQQIDRHFFRRLGNFADVGRFMVAWLLLIGVLIGGVAYQTRGLAEYYLSNQPIDGGIMSEAMIGTYTNPNPLFASSTVDVSISKLIFNSLLRYNDNGELVNDLASSVKRSDDGLIYDIGLANNILWQDGIKLTADDVVYTYKALQNPDTKSPYSVTWQSVKISKIDDYDVRFQLLSPLNSFPISLTGGILPAHALEKIPFSELRSTSFNSKPIGSGPFKISNVVRLDDFTSVTKRQRIELVKNNHYFKGAPKVDAYVLYALSSESDLKQYLNSRQVDAALFNSNPDFGVDSKAYAVDSIPLLAGTYSFFNTSKPPLDDPQLRQALLLGTNIEKLINVLGYPVQGIKSPLLATDVGYDPTLIQQGYDKTKANQVLDTLGWVRPSDSATRRKGDKVLEVSLTTLDGSDFALIASNLQQMWANDLGIKVNIITKSPADMQPILLQHTYEVLLYGITMGSDPDVYAYWHSSQAVADRYNLSLYKSDAADRSLEAGRSRPEIALRAAKYRPFLEAWRNDVPAIGLYQPPVFYVSRTKIYNFAPKKLNSSSERFFNVQNWQVLSTRRPIVK